MIRGGFHVDLRNEAFLKSVTENPLLPAFMYKSGCEHEHAEDIEL